MMGLTGKQLQLYSFICAFKAENGIAPTFEEMRVHLGIGSRSGIHRLLTSLHQRGAIRRIHHHARAIEIIGPQERAATALIHAGNLDLKTLGQNALIGLRADIDCELKRRREAA